MKSLIAISTALIMGLLVASSAGADTWSGPYFGIHAGKGWSGLTSEHRFDNWWTSGFGDNQEFKSDLAGVLKGGQAGYNYQAGRWVIGGEVSYSDANMGNSANSPYFPILDGYAADIKGIFSATVRLGYDFSGTLIYAKGGYASAKTDTSHFDVNGITSAETGRHTGTTVGAGIDHKLSPKISLGVDYNFIHLGSRQAWLDCRGPCDELEVHSDGLLATESRLEAGIHTIMVRLNFHVVEWFTFH
jgi:outer membrane immunogenic protein